MSVRVGTALLLSAVLMFTAWAMGYMAADGWYASQRALNPPPPRVMVWEELTPKPMWCKEDQALVWFDAPHKAHCVNVEDLVGEGENP